jgi:aromatic ring-cleaving dioxygenase
MAIYHMSASTGSRGGGQSAAAKAQYIGRIGKHIGRSTDLVSLHSQHMPDWVVSQHKQTDRSALKYWHAADINERENGRLFRHLEFALPRELTQEGAIDLALQFAERLTTQIDGGNLPFTLAVHSGYGSNPHGHLMISERINDGISRPENLWFRRAAVASPTGAKIDPRTGGARKTAVLKSKEWLLSTRKLWAELTNEALAKADSLERIDHRSLVARGIDRIPTLHWGPNVKGMAARQIDCDRVCVAAKIDQENEQIRQRRIESRRMRMQKCLRELQRILDRYYRLPAVASQRSGADDEVKELTPINRAIQEIVCQHLLRFGVNEFELLVKEILPTGESKYISCSAREIMQEIIKLEQLNEQGYQILIRPIPEDDSRLQLFRNLNIEQLQRVISRGRVTDIVVECEPGRYDVWLSEGKNLDVSEIVYGLNDRPEDLSVSSDEHTYGYLAGFLIGQVQTGGNGIGPYRVKLVDLVDLDSDVEIPREPPMEIPEYPLSPEVDIKLRDASSIGFNDTRFF